MLTVKDAIEMLKKHQTEKLISYQMGAKSLTVYETIKELERYDGDKSIIYWNWQAMILNGEFAQKIVLASKIIETPEWLLFI